MADRSDKVMAVRMPQANVNDEEVTLVNWYVPDGGQVEPEQPLCEIETSKSVGDVPAPAGGVVRHAAQVGDSVRVGAVYAYIGPTLEAIEALVAAGGADQRDATGPGTSQAGTAIEATAGAVELARRYGLDLARLGVSGRIRRADIEQYVAVHRLQPVRGAEATGADESASAAPPESAAATLPDALRDQVADEGELTTHQWSIAKHLAETQSRIVSTHVVMDVCMDRSVAWMEAKRKAGQMTGPIPLLLHAAAAAVKTVDKLAAFRIGRHLYRYRAINLAYTARNLEGRLFTPVIREVADRSLDELIQECTRLNMAIVRGQMTTDQMSGGCMTVSLLSDQPVTFHAGLQNAYQTAILTAGAIHDRVVVVDGQPAVRPMMTLCLAYDHGVMDGWDAAAALEAVKQTLENLPLES